MNELISVIVPVYNTEKYIVECVKCLLNQTYRNLEILVVDDGSKDNSIKVCEQYKQRDSRIKILHKENGGAASARNTGLDACTGEYIIFADSDDYMPCNAVELLYQVAKQTDANIVQGMYVKNEKEKTLEMSGEIEIYSGRDFLIKDILDNVPWGKIYKRDVWKNRRFKNGLMIYEDYQLLYQMIYESDVVVRLNSCVYIVNERYGSITRSGYSDKQTVVLNIDKERIEYYRERNENILLEHAYCDYYNHLLQLYCLSRKPYIKALYRQNFQHFWSLKCIGWRIKCKLLICFFSPSVWERKK